MADLETDKSISTRGASCPPGTAISQGTSPALETTGPLTHGDVVVEFEQVSQPKPSTWNRVKGTMSDTGERISRFGHQIADKTSQFGHQMADKTSQLSRRMTDKTTDLSQRIRNYDYGSIADRTRHRMGTRPGATVLISAGIGFGLGWMMSRGRS